MEELRIALVHDWLTGMRGGEKCLEVLNGYVGVDRHCLYRRYHGNPQEISYFDRSRCMNPQG